MTATREEYGPVRALRHGNRLLGVLPPYMQVRCFAVDGLLVDTGLADQAAAVREFCRAEGVGRAVLTHHHEDHTGNAAALAGDGLRVEGEAGTRAILARGFPVRFYQWAVWGKAPPVEVAALPEVLETDRYRFRVLAAPGHCDDQVVFHEESEGWLFSGDAFLGERIKYFRGDEDFARTITSLERLVALDFDALFCAHRPLPTGGREALRRKLEHLRELEERVRELAAKGLGLREITRRALGPEPTLLYLFSGGDLSKQNLVRSILHGPVPRPGLA